VALRPAVNPRFAFFVRQHTAAAALSAIRQRRCHLFLVPASISKLLCDSNLETRTATFCVLDHNGSAPNMPEAMLSATWQQ
jgi:hypothetical protein